MDDLYGGGNATIVEGEFETLHQAIDARIKALVTEAIDTHSRTETVTSCERALTADELPGRCKSEASSDLEVRAACVDRGGHPLDCVWAVTIDNHAVGMVRLLHEGPHVVRVSSFRIHPDWQHTPVLAKLMDRVHRYCWDHGYLKVMLESQAAPALVRRAFEHHGFHLVRRRSVLGKELLEYYVDLYTPPQREDGFHP